MKPSSESDNCCDFVVYKILLREEDAQVLAFHQKHSTLHNDSKLMRSLNGGFEHSLVFASGDCAEIALEALGISALYVIRSRQMKANGCASDSLKVQTARWLSLTFANLSRWISEASKAARDVA